MMSLLFPLCTFFLLCLCIAYWASTAVYPFSFLFLRVGSRGRKPWRHCKSSRVLNSCQSQGRIRLQSRQLRPLG